MITIHPTALVASSSIGDGTRIWAFVNILEGARIGRDCNICDRCFIENDVVVGDRVTVKCGVSLWDGVRLENDVFVGPDVAFSNDPRPRSGVHLAAHPRRSSGGRVAPSAVLLPGITVGRWALVGAGAVVTRTSATSRWRTETPPGPGASSAAARRLSPSIPATRRAPAAARFATDAAGSVTERSAS